MSYEEDTCHMRRRIHVHPLQLRIDPVPIEVGQLLDTLMRRRIHVI